MGLRIASYNIHRAIGRDGREDASRIIAVLREIDADIIALQEVGFRAEDPDHFLHCVARELDARVVDGVTLSDARGHYGNALVSRHEIADIKHHDISVAGREPRGAIEITLGIDAKRIRLIATHLGLRAAERRYQIGKLTQALNTPGVDVSVLLGDLNEWNRWGFSLRRLRKHFGASPAPATFPAHRPWLALDRIWVNPASIVGDMRAHRSELARIASDHLPLLARLEL